MTLNIRYFLTPFEMGRKIIGFGLLAALVYGLAKVFNLSGMLEAWVDANPLLVLLGFLALMLFALEAFELRRVKPDSSRRRDIVIKLDPKSVGKGA